MTTFLLIRHASHDLLGRMLVGRGPGPPLNAQGRKETTRLAARLAGEKIAALFASPRERTLETAAPIAERLGVVIEIDSAFDEIDFGEWTGRNFADLDGDSEWRRWNEERSRAHPPGGETISRAQKRAVAEIQKLCQLWTNAQVAIVSHGDLIKSILAHYLGISLDHLERFEISPGSVSTVVVGSDWARVFAVNANSAHAPE